MLVLFGDTLAARTAGRRGDRPARQQVRWPLWAATLGSGIYGGYFGAAQGVLLLGLFGIFLTETLQRQNAQKNVQAGLVNLVAAIVFVITAHIDWAAAGLIAAGTVVGGLIGASVGRRLPPNALRAIIVVIGVAALVKLIVDP